uniref:Uncharacterized protein n=1 Tax=Caulobacter sp. (strain K31) TaxID=366602 RepID=B0T086_CAUSK
MGFKISWIGFNGLEQAECLSRLGMIETPVVDEANEAPFSLAVLPNSWIILFANDFEYVTEDRLATLSRGATVIGCHIHEGIMYADAMLYNDGKAVWSLSHFVGDGRFDLKTTGAPPGEIEQIRVKLIAEQKMNDEAHADTDFIFDIPVEAARLVTGYRHDQWKFDWGEPVFHELRPARRGK